MQQDCVSESRQDSKKETTTHLTFCDFKGKVSQSTAVRHVREARNATGQCLRPECKQQDSDVGAPARQVASTQHPRGGAAGVPARLPQA